jgi:hypothetical protein
LKTISMDLTRLGNRFVLERPRLIDQPPPSFPSVRQAKPDCSC